MHSQLLPAIAAPPGYEDGRGASLIAEKREDFSQKINLDLGIGSCAYGSGGGLKRNKKIKQKNKESVFTALQFHEFYSQILVYNSIIFGLPVAFHLLLPIWMSVSNSLGPAIYKKYPTFRGFSPQNSDHSSVMDPEPGRCRRTDGRKWRCSKNVVPNQKYCERHLHRGRRGSRKRVEPVGSILRPDNKTSDNIRMPTMSLVTSEIDNIIAISIQSDLDLCQPCSKCRSGFPEILKCRSDGNCNASFANKSSIDVITVGNGVKKNIDVDRATNTCSSSKTDCPTNEGKVGLGLGNKNTIEIVPQRCRRTDGKKWQCRRDALPSQKYCEAHMHRGSKKLMAVSNSRATSAQKAHTSCSITRNLGHVINLNTVPISPEHIVSNNSTSSTSDATTITDENISFCPAQSLNYC